jgi:hypothetical protein
MVLFDDGDHPMTRLSDTQLVILTAAAQRADLSILPLPEGLNLKGGALNKVMDSLRNRGLIRVIGGDGGPSAWSSPARAWRRSVSRRRPRRRQRPPPQPRPRPRPTVPPCPGVPQRGRRRARVGGTEARQAQGEGFASQEDRRRTRR